MHARTYDDTLNDKENQTNLFIIHAFQVIFISNTMNRCFIIDGIHSLIKCSIGLNDNDSFGLN